MEIWRDIAGYSGEYKISNHGRVKSIVAGGLIMSNPRNYSGYRVVSLRGSKPRKQFRVHCLVLEAFVGPRPEGHQGCHNDNDKNNNHIGNLRWNTPKGNMTDRKSYEGQANPNSKISDAQKIEIRKRYLTGETCREIGVDFGISGVRVSQIGRNK